MMDQETAEQKGGRSVMYAPRCPVCGGPSYRVTSIDDTHEQYICVSLDSIDRPHEKPPCRQWSGRPTDKHAQAQARLHLDAMRLRLVEEEH